MAKRELVDRSDSGFCHLPDTTIWEIFNHLTLTERQHYLATCNRLWGLRSDLYGRLTRLEITRTHGDDALVGKSSTDCLTVEWRHSQQLVLSHFNGLQNLNLGIIATDPFLCVLSQNELLPNLRHIGMVGSSEVTDSGLLHLSFGGNSRKQNLSSVDITFCRNTSYAGTFPLRDNLDNLKIIRRQPRWMDGSYITPFASNNREDTAEVHVYYADGSFSFNRPTQSSGFVCDLFVFDETCNHLGNKLQYNNFSAPENWPYWTQFCYRPGVSVLRVPDIDHSDGKIRCSVLVSQTLSGLRPPNNISVLEKALSLKIEIGKTINFDRKGDLLDDNEAEDEKRHIMVSHMHLNPLPCDPEMMMPPADLVKNNRKTCNNLKVFSEVEMSEREELLHRLLLG